MLLDIPILEVLTERQCNPLQPNSTTPYNGPRTFLLAIPCVQEINLEKVYKNKKRVYLAS